MILHSPQKLLELTKNEQNIRSFCGMDHIEEGAAESYAKGKHPLSDVPTSQTASELQKKLETEGYASLNIASHSPTHKLLPLLAKAIFKLESEGLSPTLIYLLPEVWELGEAISHALGHSLQKPEAKLKNPRYEIISDAYAFCISTGQEGWPPHRGNEDENILTEDGIPKLLNVWLALTDVASDMACIHAVPLCKDPNYPHNLKSKTAPLESVRALPVSQGTALFWNANLLHWGGAFSDFAKGARIAISYTLALENHFQKLPRAQSKSSFLERKKTVLNQFQIYGENDKSLSSTMREWITLELGLEMASRSLLGIRGK